MGKSQYTLAISSLVFRQPIGSNNYEVYPIKMYDMIELPSFFSYQVVFALLNHYKKIYTLYKVFIIQSWIWNFHNMETGNMKIIWKYGLASSVMSIT